MGTGRRRRGPWVVVPLIILALALGAIFLKAAGSDGSSLSAQKLYDRLGLPLARLLCYLGVGLLAGQVTETLGWTAKLAAWARPLMRWGHLKDESGAAFTAAFVSAIFSNTLLMTFHQEGKITRREMVLTYLINTGLPVYFLHLPSTFFIILSLTGRAGLIYLGIALLAAAMRSLGLLWYSRIKLPAPSGGDGTAPAPHRRKEGRVAAQIWKTFRRRFARLILFTFPIYILVFFMNEWHIFEWLRGTLAEGISSQFFPVEAASVVIFSVAAEFTSGMAAAGALLDGGALTVHQTAVALVAGSIVATPVRALRHQLPSHVGIFKPGLGSELLIMSQGLRVLSLVVVTALYLAME